jgi:hypothetical protein
MATFVHFPPRECLKIWRLLRIFPPGNASKYGDFCLFFDPKKPFVQLISRLLNFIFLSPTPCQIFARKKKLNKTHTHTLSHRHIPCLPEWKYKNNNNNNKTLGVTWLCCCNKFQLMMQLSQAGKWWYRRLGRKMTCVSDGLLWTWRKKCTTQEADSTRDFVM